MNGLSVVLSIALAYFSDFYNLIYINITIFVSEKESKPMTFSFGAPAATPAVSTGFTLGAPPAKAPAAGSNFSFGGAASATPAQTKTHQSQQQAAR